MGVAMEMAVPGIDWNHAAGAGNRAAHVLELHGGVVDMESVSQHTFDPMEDMIALRRRHIGNEHVTAQRVGIRTQTPDMQIVDVENSLNGSNGGDHLFQLKAFWQTFEQNVERFPGDIPSRPDNQR